MSLAICSTKEQVSEQEWALREDLAAAFRLAALFGWDDLIYTHMSLRLPGEHNHLLINPFGLLFEEITASNLVKINLAGDKVMDSPYEINKAGLVIHSAIHEARPDIQCVIHLHTDYGVAVSIQEQGLQRLSQFSGIPHALMAYHDYEGIAVRDEEKERLVENLGHNLAMILRNHGTLTLGDTVGKAFELMYLMERACKTQILAQAGGNKLIQVNDCAQANIIQGILEVQAAPVKTVSSWDALRRKLDRLAPDYKN